jgi:surfactin synthase thioesterase subunit
MSSVSVFCLPHAGGGAHHYSNWSDHIGRGICWKPIDYAGHFSRAEEQHYSSFAAAAEDIANLVVRVGEDKPLALFGHSMGGALAYEVGWRLEQRVPRGQLKFVAVSSAPPPHDRDTSMTRYFALPDDDFIGHLLDTGGISVQHASQRQLMDQFLPLIRQDYELYHHYELQEHKKLNCRLGVMWGDDDNIKLSNMSSWTRYSQNEVIIRSWPGGHFHWHRNLPELCAELLNLARKGLADE